MNATATHHVALVVNPNSGRGHAEAISEAAVKRLSDIGWLVERAAGSELSQVRGSLAEILHRGADTVVVVGGDGAVHGVLDLLMASDAVLGVIPAGTGNDFARTLGLPYRDTDACVELIVRHPTRRIDLIRAGDHLVATVIACGFDSKVNERANAMRWPRGALRYYRAILAELRDFRPEPFTLAVSGNGHAQEISVDAMLVAIGNGESFGGGLRIAHGASIDDGSLDVCVIHPLTRRALIRLFPRLYRGTHVTVDEFERIAAASVHIDAPGIVAYGDGERLGPLPLEVQILPAALSVIAPVSPTA